MLTRRAHGVIAPTKSATALPPVVQVCAVAPLTKASPPTPISNSARDTFIPVPARDMLSLQSFAAQAEASCKYGDVSPTAC